MAPTFEFGRTLRRAPPDILPFTGLVQSHADKRTGLRSGPRAIIYGPRATKPSALWMRGSDPERTVPSALLELEPTPQKHRNTTEIKKSTFTPFGPVDVFVLSFSFPRHFNGLELRVKD